LVSYPPLQGFTRSTTKYWVRNEDVSTVKHHVLQHLPVFQFDKNIFTGDAQVGMFAKFCV
jgi:SPX domain protein involved in polyphosphate accumulation